MAEQETGTRSLAPGAVGRPRFDLQRFQQEVAAEIGIDLNRAAQRYPYVRELEPATHSDTQRGGGRGGE